MTAHQHAIADVTGLADILLRHDQKIRRALIISGVSSAELRVEEKTGAMAIARAEDVPPKAAARALGCIAEILWPGGDPDVEHDVYWIGQIEQVMREAGLGPKARSK